VNGPLAIAAAAFGAVAGSFAVTAGIRLARGERWALGRSHCDGCGAMLTFAETAPVVGYVRARGACARCGGRIDPSHLAGELIGAVVAAAAFAVTADARALPLSILGLVLLCAAVVDLRVRRLPDVLVATVALLGLLLAAAEGWGAAAAGVVAAAVAGLLLLAIRSLSVAGDRSPGLGLGDVKLISALALWLGPATPLMVAVAAVLGLVLAARLRGADGRLPFGPMIAAAGWLVGLAHEVRAIPWMW
jgi:leader peptidase (prepilin peptidase)/N-methyltransferase